MASPSLIRAFDCSTICTMTYESWLKTNAEKEQDNEIRFQMPGIIFGSNLCKPTDFDYSDEAIVKGDTKNLADNYQGNLVSFESVS